MTRTFSGVPGDSQCECADAGCLAHEGLGCHELATTILYRVDMDDLSGTAFCEACAEDAMESGLFTDIRTCACGSYDEGECPTCDKDSADQTSQSA
jgi:hypothetical protein